MTILEDRQKGGVPHSVRDFLNLLVTPMPGSSRAGHLDILNDTEDAPPKKKSVIPDIIEPEFNVDDSLLLAFNGLDNEPVGRNEDIEFVNAAHEIDSVHAAVTPVGLPAVVDDLLEDELEYLDPDEEMQLYHLTASVNVLSESEASSFQQTLALTYPKFRPSVESSLSAGVPANLYVRRLKFLLRMPGQKRSKRVARRAKKRGGTGVKMTPDAIGYLNPFAGTQPRIADGSVASSFPKTHKNVEVATIPANQVGHFFLYPGYYGGLVWSAVGAPNPLVPIAIDNYMTYSQSNEYLVTGNEAMSWKAATALASTDIRVHHQYGNIAPQGDVHKWRLVSQGLKMSLLNTDENNDGWFESCRVHRQREENDYQITIPAGTTTQVVSGFEKILTLIKNSSDNIDPPRLYPTGNVWNGGYGGGSLAENEGYSAAPLKMVGAATWSLLPYQEGHPFREIDDQYSFDERSLYTGVDTPDNSYNQDGAIVGPDNAITFWNGDVEAKRFLDGLIDFTHDCVYIRVHAGATPAKLLLQHVCNMEVVVKINTELHKYMDPAPGIADHRKLRNMKLGI